MQALTRRGSNPGPCADRSKCCSNSTIWCPFRGGAGNLIPGHKKVRDASGHCPIGFAEVLWRFSFGALRETPRMSNFVHCGLCAWNFLGNGSETMSQQKTAVTLHDKVLPGREDFQGMKTHIPKRWEVACCFTGFAGNDHWHGGGLK